MKFEDSAVNFWAWPGTFGSHDWSEFTMVKCRSDRAWGMSLTCGSAGAVDLPPRKVVSEEVHPVERSSHVRRELQGACADTAAELRGITAGQELIRSSLRTTAKCRRFTSGRAWTNIAGDATEDEAGG